MKNISCIFFHLADGIVNECDKTVHIPFHIFFTHKLTTFTKYIIINMLDYVRRIFMDKFEIFLNKTEIFLEKANKFLDKVLLITAQLTLIAWILVPIIRLIMK